MRFALAGLLMLVVMQPAVMRGGYVAPVVPDEVDTLLESWPLTEVSDGSGAVLRLGANSDAQTINPRRIDLLDPIHAEGDATNGVLLTNDGEYLQTEVNNEQGTLRAQNFVPTSIWTFEVDVKLSVTAAAKQYIANRDNSFILFVESFPKQLKLSCYAADGTTLDTVTLIEPELEADVLYTVRAGWTGTKLWVELDGEHYAESSVLGERYTITYMPLELSHDGFPLNGYLKNASWRRSPKNAPAARPFGTATLIAANFETTTNVDVWGLYFFKPTYDPIGDRWVWVFSTDHDSDEPENPSGIRIGYSASPSVKPASYALAIPTPGTFTDDPSGNSIQPFDLETPCLKYVPALARPWLCYGHCYINNGWPGLTDPQATVVFSAETPSDDPADWQLEGDGLCIPVDASFAYPPLQQTHTGYANILAPDEFTGIEKWQAHHLSWEPRNVNRRTLSDDPFLFDANTSEILDMASAFPAGYDTVWWWANYLEINGTVYGVGTAYMPTGRGVVICELELVGVSPNRVYVPTGRIWDLVYATDVFPAVPTEDSGYIQYATAIYHGGVIHLWVLRGFYLFSRDERIDYYTVSVL